VARCQTESKTRLQAIQSQLRKLETDPEYPQQANVVTRPWPEREEHPQPTNGYIAPSVDREAPDYIDAKLARISGWIDEFQDPGDGLPTPESVAGNFDNLERLRLAINNQQSVDDATKLTMLYDNVYTRLAALSDRVQQSLEAA
jgi:hypothetical protein